MELTLVENRSCMQVLMINREKFMDDNSMNILSDLGIDINVSEIIDSALDVLESSDSDSIRNLVMVLIKLPTRIRDFVFWNKFFKFVNGVRDFQEQLGEGVKFCTKLIENEKDKEKNGIRIIEIIDKIDTVEKMDYVLYNTFSYLKGEISKEDYFRISKAIVDTLYEDLVYLKSIATDLNGLRGNIQILSLARTGLLIADGIDGNYDIEAQEYIVTSLGRLVDRYALSYDDEDRQRWYKEFKPRPMYRLGIDK
jgi:hypothetical protein